MTVYIVTYDLVGEPDGEHDYQSLYDAFDKLESHRVLYSVWLVSTQMTVKGLHDHLYAKMDKNDRIWVCRQRPGEFDYHAMNGTNDWLKRNPPS